jgi:hypothetical protein
LACDASDDHPPNRRFCVGDLSLKTKNALC